MAEHVIGKGLTLPINGAPEQTIGPGPAVSRVAVIGDDYPTMKPRMHVAVGDVVKRGQLLFEDRKSEGVCFTSPGAGEVVAINRGEKRRFVSMVIALNEAERSPEPGDEIHTDFNAYSGRGVAELSTEDTRALLVESGLWTSLRTRPYGRIPAPSDSCQGIFVTAIDTNPLAASVDVVLAGKEEDFKTGLEAIRKLTEGPVRLCVASGSSVNTQGVAGIDLESFRGPHPAGLVGTHIHLLEGVHREKFVWHLGYQDVVAIGRLFTTGRVDVERVVSLAGPVVASPRLVTTRMGASTTELSAGETSGDGDHRIVAGSVLYGRRAQDEVQGYLGRYHQQVSCLAEDRERVFLGWLRPGLNKFSTIRAFASAVLGRRSYDFTTNNQGEHRAMVPIGMLERVMPLDIMPTFLLRALLVDDVETAEKLGCLELDEEDLALCSFVSPGKEDYGVALRRVLDDIWREG